MSKPEYPRENGEWKLGKNVSCHVLWHKRDIEFGEEDFESSSFGLLTTTVGTSVAATTTVTTYFVATTTAVTCVATTTIAMTSVTATTTTASFDVTTTKDTPPPAMKAPP
jgi:hypothetical protein